MKDKPSYEELEEKIRNLEEETSKYNRVLEAYHSVAESTSDFIYLVDRQCQYLLTNKAYCTRLGLSGDKLKGRHYNEFHSSEASGKFQEKVEQVFATGESMQHAYRDDNTDRYFLRTFSPVRVPGAEGKITSVTVISKEITNRKRMEDALKISEERSRGILDNIADGYYEVDLKGKFTFLNETVKRRFGIVQDDYVDIDYRQFTSEEEIKRIFRIVNEVYRTGEGKTGVELEVTPPDSSGIHYYYELSVSPIKDPRGHVVGFRGIIRDMTERKEMVEALRRSEERYRNIIENIEAGFYEVDLSGNFTFLNDYTKRILGYLPIGINFRKFLDNETAKKMIKIFNSVYQTGKAATRMELEMISGDKKKLSLEYSVSLIKDSSGQGAGFRGIIYDITERKQLEETLKGSEERYRSIIEKIEDGYYEIAIGGDPLFCNDAYLKIIGLSREEWMASNFRHYTDQENMDKLSAIFTEIFLTGVPATGIEWTITRKDGLVRNIEETVSLMKNVKGEPVGYRGVIRDVTERKNMELYIRQLAYHDFLTGLPNRLLFFDRFKVALEHAKRNNQMLAVMELDLDGFKAVNDSYGHHIGDLLLQAVANLLQGALRKSDTAARIGGDEFTMLLPEIKDVRDAGGVAEKILKSFERQFLCGDHILKITPSIGIAVFPEHGDNVDSLINRADTAMYRAKEMGKNNYQI